MIPALSLKKLPDKNNLRRICKAISVMDAVLSPERESRYYFYDAHWRKDEEFFEMRNGEGDHLFLLFRQEGSVINCFCRKSQKLPISDVTNGLPPIFNEFILGEPFRSVGTTLCIWTDEKGKWTNFPSTKKKCAGELLGIFDGKPQTYVKWAQEYFEGRSKVTGIPLPIVESVYDEQPLTKKMVLSVTEGKIDWDLLQSDMEEIDYITDFK